MSNYNVDTNKVRSNCIVQWAHLLAQADTSVATPIFGAVYLVSGDTQLWSLIETHLIYSGIKRNLRKFGKRGDEVASSDLWQLHDMQVMRP